MPQLPPGFSHPVALGSGGFGTVYRARQDALNRQVVLKFIIEKKSVARAQILKEASMQAQLHLPGVPEVYDVKEIGGSICIVMQWVQGASVRDLIGKDVAPEYIRVVVTEIIRVTAALHKEGFVHRDIKPENIIVASDGVYFIDFGFSVDVQQHNPNGADETVKGTPAYLAPELLSGKGADVDLTRSDLYSMAKVIQELLGSEVHPSVITACVNELPEKRPASAVEVLQRWMDYSAPTDISEWAQVTNEWTGNIIAEQLFAAVQSLLQSRRSEEAYSLLLECINVCPECPDALDLIARFPVIKKNQTSLERFRYGIAACVVFVLALVVVVVYRSVHDSDNEVVSGNHEYGRSLFINADHESVVTIDRMLPFKDEPGMNKYIVGSLEMTNHLKAGSLFIDGKHITDSVVKVQLPTRTTEHHVVFRKKNGSVAWKEVVALHPFEIKRICIKER